MDNRCENCGNLIILKYGSGRFCSKKCARGFSTKTTRKEINLKVSKSLTGRDGVKDPNKRKEFICPTCGNKYSIYVSDKRKYCSVKCISYKDHKGGGYYKNSSRGKSGWYKGYWCDSSWELAWVIYNIENSIEFKRNTEGFKYKYEHKVYNYFPDFILNNEEIYIEIKGWMTEKNRQKILQFPKKLNVLTGNEMKPILEYVRNKYGEDFISLYEDKKLTIYTNTCKNCGVKCNRRNDFCGNSCSMKYRHKLKKNTT
jgi:hypothetical protein